VQSEALLHEHSSKDPGLRRGRDEAKFRELQERRSEIYMKAIPES
jgi:hypothetical protein